MTKHTAGPWKFKRVDHAALAKNSSVNLLTDGEGFNLGLLSTWRNSPESEMEAEANARLIAAAPDLLEAAQKVVDAWAKFIDSFDYVPGIGDKAEDMEFREIALLRAAIAKARGEV